MSTTAVSLPFNRAKSVALWAVQIGLAYYLIRPAVAKLTGAPMMVGLFEAIGFGQWFRYLTGALELIAAVAVLVPQTARYGALLIAVVMTGAVATHLFIVGGSPLMAAALLAGAVIVAWGRRNG